jgi:beta-ring hydroxylase
MPSASGDLREIVGQPVFVPLYSLFRVYGPIFKLSFGPQSFVVLSDPAMAKQVRARRRDAAAACKWQHYVQALSDGALGERHRVQVLLTNASKYSKGILSEILDFVMGTGLIPADGEVWKTRRRHAALPS